MSFIWSFRNKKTFGREYRYFFFFFYTVAATTGKKKDFEVACMPRAAGKTGRQCFWCWYCKRRAKRLCRWQRSTTVQRKIEWEHVVFVLLNSTLSIDMWTIKCRVFSSLSPVDIHQKKQGFSWHHFLVWKWALFVWKQVRFTWKFVFTPIKLFSHQKEPVSGTSDMTCPVHTRWYETWYSKCFTPWGMKPALYLSIHTNTVCYIL